MIKLSVYWKKAALAAAVSAVLLAGCSSGSTAVTDEESVAESEAAVGADDSGVNMADEFQQDAIRIQILKPVKPDDMGTVSSLVYKGLDIEAPLAEEITYEDVDEYLSTYILPYMAVEVDDGIVQDGDTVNIDYVGTIDGVAFDGGTGNYDLVIGSGSFIDGFEEGLIGAAKGDSVSLDLTFPEDYWSEELAGQDVNFAVEINSISRYLTLDEYNDEAARTLMDDESATVESSKEYVLEYLQKLADVSAKSTLYSNAIKAALEASEVEPSEEAKEWDLDVTIKSYDANLQVQGYNLAYYLYYGVGTTYDEFREELRAEIDESAAEAVLKYAICEAEGLEYNDETRAMYLEEFGYTSEELDEAAEELQQEQAIIWYLAGKTIVENGTVTYTEPEPVYDGLTADADVDEDDDEAEDAADDDMEGAAEVEGTADDDIEGTAEVKDAADDDTEGAAEVEDDTDNEEGDAAAEDASDGQAE